MQRFKAATFIVFIALCFYVATAFGADYFKGSPASLHEGTTVQTGVGGVTTLTVSSNTNRVLASGSHTDRLPTGTAIGAIGRFFNFANRGSGTYTVQYQDGTTLTTVLPGRQKRVVLTDATTSNGVWDIGFGEALDKTGDTMSGSLGLAGSGTTPDTVLKLDGSRRVQSTGVSGTEIEYVDGVTAAIQTQLDAKVNRAADTMTGPLGLNYATVTPDRAAYVDGSRILRTSTSVSSQELEYLDGVTGNIQAQIAAAGGGGSFLPLSGGTLTGPLLLDTATLTTLNANPLFRRTTAADLLARFEGINGQNKGIGFYTGGSASTNLRWALVSNSSSETGSNAGSNLAIQAYDDSGSLIDQPCIFTRAASGTMSCSRPVTFSSTSTANFGGTIKANQDIQLGQVGSGSGGKVRHYYDDGTEGFRAGPTGSAGDRTWTLRGIVAGADLIQVSSAGMFTTFFGTADGSASIQTPSSPSSYTIGDRVSTFIVAPSTTLTTSTVIMPASPANNQIVNVSCSGNRIEQLVHLPSGSHTLQSPLKSCEQGTGARYIYHNSGSGIWRVLNKGEPMTSEVFVRTANGYGSTNNKIRRFTTTDINVGSSITYADSATNGATFTLNETGVYAITYCDQFNGASNMGVTLNSASLTTDIGAVTGSTIVCGTTTGTANIGTCCSFTAKFTAADIIRAHTGGLASGTNTWMESFRVRRLGP